MHDLPTPTGRELEILKVLWDAGPSSVRGVHEAMLEASGEEIAYNTIQTLLRIMESKQLVKHPPRANVCLHASLQPGAERHAFSIAFSTGAASELMLSDPAERVPADELDRMSTDRPRETASGGRWAMIAPWELFESWPSASSFSPAWFSSGPRLACVYAAAARQPSSERRRWWPPWQ